MRLNKRSGVQVFIEPSVCLLAYIVHHNLLNIEETWGVSHNLLNIEETWGVSHNLLNMEKPESAPYTVKSPQ
jgi:hypothetical protein